MKTDKDLIAPCGLDCFNCQVYEKNISGEMKAMLADHLKLEEDKIPCRGCRQQKGTRLNFASCATYDCAMEKGVDYCFECSDFPCAKLQPAVDGADRYPHNMKLYNLCRMKLVGIKKWADEESADIRKKYFSGKFVVGLGPVLD